MSWSQIEIIQFNRRFSVIKVPSKYVTTGWEKADDGLSVCWVEARTPTMNFDFVTRRAISHDYCLSLINSTREIIRNSKYVEIYGNGPLQDETPYLNSYFSLWEMTNGKSGCVSYFSGDECLNEVDIYSEMNYFKYRPIDPAMMLNSFSFLFVPNL
jgi:hypothetical protein